MVYTTNMLLEKYINYSNPYDKIRRECLEGNLIKLKRGLYDDDKTIPPYMRSGYIYGPSYISFEFALSFFELIPEYVPNVTCASFRKNKKKRYDTDICSYIYRDVPAKVFPLSVIPHIEKGYSYLMATPEKALCDELYTVKQVHNFDDFTALLLEDLRVDMGALREVNWDSVKDLAPLYERSNTDYLLTYWEKEIKK